MSKLPRRTRGRGRWIAGFGPRKDEMRKEDKRQLPAQLKCRLPQGFYLKRVPGCYLLYFAGPALGGMLMAVLDPKIDRHELVCSFGANTEGEEIVLKAYEVMRRMSLLRK